MGKTLDYDSVANWMSLAVWAAREYRIIDLPPYATDEDYTEFFHEIAVEALNRGFSLRAGDRADAIGRLLNAIAPQDSKLLSAYTRIDRESWLTTPGQRPSGSKTQSGERKQAHA
jgi:hypothetical protein